MDIKRNLKTVFNYRRFNSLSNFVILVFIILVIRLIYLQIISPDQLINEGDMRSLRIQSIPVSRGIITDRMGRLLAVNIPVYSIFIDPIEINKYGGIAANFYCWNKLSEILSISVKKVSSIINNHSKDHFVYLARQLDPSIFREINQLKILGVYSQQESRRYYPAGCLTAQLVGITNIDNQGIEGIEKSFNTYLMGQSSTRMVRKDRGGRVIENVILNHGRESKNITLSIDERLQRIAYRELYNAVNINKAESGSIVLIDINTGEILVMVNVPSYNPNNLSMINQSVMRNRAITDAFEPGSTVKPIVIMTALKYDVIKRDTVVNTLPYVIGGHRVKDVISYNELTVQEILQKSSNVGVSKLALAMPASFLVNSYEDFGMGKTTNIGLIGESSGIYPYNRHLSDIERVVFSYGYGLTVTPLQLAKVYATIGGMGCSKPLSIFKVHSPIIGNQIFPASLVRTVIDMMESVVSPGNCGSQAAIAGYRVAVKTGTVKKVGTHGKYVNKYVAYTAGIAPASNPKYALVVIINDPKNGHYYGGKISAPVFSVVMQNILKIMHITPDSLLKNQDSSG